MNPHPLPALKPHAVMAPFRHGRHLRRGALQVLISVTLAWGGGALADGPPTVAAILYEEALVALDLGETERARDLLRAVVQREPRHAGAWLDLALTLCRLGERRQGQAILRQLDQRFDPPPALREIIARFAANECAAAPKLRLSAGLALGHDDNVNLGASRERTRLVTDAGVVEVLIGQGMRARPDRFAEVWASLDWGDAPVRLDLSLRQHARAHDLDAQTLRLEGWQTWAHARGLTRLRGRLAHTWLDERPFLQGLELELDHRGAPGRLTPSAGLRLELQRFPAHPAYDALPVELRAGLRHDGPALSLGAVALATDNHALAARPGGDRQGLGLQLDAVWALAPRMVLLARARCERQRDHEPYAPPLLPMRRSQTLRHWQIELRHSPRPGLDLILGWQRRASDGTLDFLDYEADIVQAGLQWTWRP